MPRAKQQRLNIPCCLSRQNLERRMKGVLEFRDRRGLAGREARRGRTAVIYLLRRSELPRWRFDPAWCRHLPHLDGADLGRIHGNIDTRAARPVSTVTSKPSIGLVPCEATPLNAFPTRRTLVPFDPSPDVSTLGKGPATRTRAKVRCSSGTLVGKAAGI